LPFIIITIIHLHLFTDTKSEAYLYIKPLQNLGNKWATKHIENVLTDDKNKQISHIVSDTKSLFFFG